MNFKNFLAEQTAEQEQLNTNTIAYPSFLMTPPFTLDAGEPNNIFMKQIADYEVDVIQPFSVEQHRVVHQGDRFSFVRWGSQCDLILPLRKDLTIKPIAPDMVHVKAGIDKVIQFI